MRVDRVRKLLDAARSSLGRLPGWALIVSAVVAVAILGEIVYLAVGSGDEEEPGSSEVTLPCNDRAADNAVNADRFAHEVRGLLSLIHI